MSKTAHQAIQPGTTHHFVSEDGWTLAGYVAAVPNGHPEIRFTYRPTPIEERELMVTAINRVPDTDPLGANRLLAKYLASKVKSWSIALPLIADSMLRLKPLIWLRLRDIVIYGTGVSDTDPEWKQESTDPATIDKLLAELQSRPGETVVEELAKN